MDILGASTRMISHRWVRMVRATGRRSKRTWGAYSSRSSKKICMDRGILTKVTSFGVDVIGGGKEGDAKDKTGVTDGRNPNWVHPGGYSQRDTSSWSVSCG